MKKIAFLSILAAGILMAAEDEKRETIKPISTQNEAIELINRLINANQSFSVKLSNPMLPGKMRMWQQRGLVRYPTKMTPWVTFKKDVQQFGSDLHQLLSQDPQTNKYYHLDELRKNHELYRQLQGIDKALKEHEPNIEMAKPFLLGKESLEAMQKIINAYGTAFYQDKLLEQIKQVIKGFEKEAEQIRKTQEKAQEKARGSRPEQIGVDDIDIELYEPISYQAPSYEPSYESEPAFNLEELELDDNFVRSFFE